VAIAEKSKVIPYGRQHITPDDIAAVVETMQSDYLTQGPKVTEFERKFAEYIGCQYAVAVANGTAALHLCALALEVQPGTRVITTPITFVASANCVRYCGGTVEFADIDPTTGLLDIRQVRALLESEPKGYYSGIIPVDFAGFPVNLEKYRELADEWGLWIIEDACHAPGGYFTDSRGVRQNCGNGAFADLAIFSFHPVKHIATGEGGMITTNRKDLYEKLLMLRTHGITRDDKLFQNPVEIALGNEAGKKAGQGEQVYPGWYMEMQTLGFNYRMPDMLTALGISQLQRAEEGVLRRREIARRYDQAFGGHDKIAILNPATTFTEGNGSLSQLGHAYHLYVIQVSDRKALYDYLKSNNILAQVHYIPAHLMPAYQQLGWKSGDFPAAEEYYSHCLSLPIFPSLTDEEQAYVIEKVLSFLQ
jgi:UDP-4-amino-4,6-dideoxy-N-acetyl-beta-L-altrosamine transaminase